MNCSASLLPHPDNPASAAGKIDANLALDERFLRLTYQVLLSNTRLRLPRRRPEPITDSRRDGLWQQTCCEAFIAAANQPGYLEFNFAPNGDWACYAFDDYRQNATQAPLPASPLIECQILNHGFCLTAIVDRNILPTASRWDIGLSAVLEDESGNTSYWALQHDSPQPDFHRRSSFTLTLP